MKIRTFYTLSDDVYRVSIYTEDWSQADNDLMVKYGEPQIDVGGSFTTSELTPVTFTLPSSLKNLKSESPFAQQFDFRDYTDAKARALAWQTELATRITAAVNTLRMNSDGYTGETVVGV